MVEDAVIRSDGRDDEPMPQGVSIAIDGPVASGKGTLAKALARRLGGFYLDTGAMYRAVAVAAKDRGLNVENPSDVQSVLPWRRVYALQLNYECRLRQHPLEHGLALLVA